MAEIQKGLARAFPATLAYRNFLVRTLNNLAVIDLNADRSEAALAEFREVRDLRERIARDDPGAGLHRLELAQADQYLGNVLAPLKRWADAEAALKRSLEAFERLVAENPGDRDAAIEMAACLNVRGTLERLRVARPIRSRGTRGRTPSSPVLTGHLRRLTADGPSSTMPVATRATARDRPEAPS